MQSAESSVILRDLMHHYFAFRAGRSDSSCLPLNNQLEETSGQMRTRRRLWDPSGEVKGPSGDYNNNYKHSYILMPTEQSGSLDSKSWQNSLYLFFFLIKPAHHKRVKTSLHGSIHWTVAVKLIIHSWHELSDYIRNIELVWISHIFKLAVGWRQDSLWSLYYFFPPKRWRMANHSLNQSLTSV